MRPDNMPRSFAPAHNEQTPRELPELPGSDIDVMRDVYMTGTQRKAFDSILARLAESEARAEALRKSLAEMIELRQATQDGRVTEKHELDILRGAKAAIAQEAKHEK